MYYQDEIDEYTLSGLQLLILQETLSFLTLEEVQAYNRVYGIRFTIEDGKITNYHFYYENS